MECLGGAATSEWVFAVSLRFRGRDECWGHIVRLTLPPPLLTVLESAMLNVAAFERLWHGRCESGSSSCGPRFALCTAHWLDLSHLCGFHAYWYQRREWGQAATELLQMICRGAGWDPKEIANQLTWQRVLLT